MASTQQEDCYDKHSDACSLQWSHPLAEYEDSGWNREYNPTNAYDRCDNDGVVFLQGELLEKKRSQAEAHEEKNQQQD
jgi:hypothetical protein